ncbi:MAG: hypothetical protein AABX17_01355 [Nanoarchaeota archaeon]
MIVAVRISGLIKIEKAHVEETMRRLRMKRKYTCVLLNEKPETLGMIKIVKNIIAYGKLDEKMLVLLLKNRGKKIGNVKAKLTEAEATKIAKEVMAGKSLEDCGIVPFFGLHPARGGINTKLHFPKGVLGYNKDKKTGEEKINDLLGRML